jgi:hypothetical protein
MKKLSDSHKSQEADFYFAAYVYALPLSPLITAQHSIVVLLARPFHVRAFTLPVMPCFAWRTNVSSVPDVHQLLRSSVQDADECWEHTVRCSFCFEILNNRFLPKA